GIVPERLASRPGLVSVIVSDGIEQRILEREFHYLNDLNIQSITPVSGPVVGGSTVTLRGTGLHEETVVSIGGQIAEVISPGDGEEMVIRTPPIPSGTPPGAVDLTLSGPLQTRHLTDAWTYMEADQGGAMKLVHAWPASGSSTGGDVIALGVQNLLSSVSSLVEITFNEEPGTVLQIDGVTGLVLVRTPSGLVGPVTLSVKIGEVSASRGDLYAYSAPLEIQEVVPPEGALEGGEQIHLVGDGFSDASVVRFGDAEAELVELTEEGDLIVTSPPGVPGLVDLTVSDGVRAHVLESAFGYASSGAPRLLGLSAASGSQSGGRLVRLFGEGWLRDQLNSTSALFGEDRGADLVVIDDATLEVRAPRGDVGSVTVKINGAGSMAMAYDYFDPTMRYGGASGGPIPEALNVTVLDALTGGPVEEAFVILWDDLDTPFQGLTDDRGQLTFSDAGFGPPQMVTASKDMYTTSSIVDFDSRNATVRIFPLAPPAPPGPGGGNPVEPPVPATISGEVTGYEKYVIPPPGSCDAKLEAGLSEGVLCHPCESDADCGDPESGHRCSLLGDQGARCTAPCEQTDDCPDGFQCVGVGFGAIQCVPSPGARTAWCGTTSPDIFSADPDAPTGFTNGASVYQVPADPGEHAVVCLGGYMDPDTNVFTPMMMGVRRHIFTLEGQELIDQDVHLDIPLTRTLRIRLDDAPTGEGTARNHRVEVFLDLGADGVFMMPERGEGVDQNLFNLEGFPSTFSESLYDASYVVLASAVSDEAISMGSNEGSFALHTDIRTLGNDVLYRVDGHGAQVGTTGITNDVYDMHGPGGNRVWAAGSEGRVLVWDGTWWALQQTPTDARLNAVWALSDEHVWVAGDEGVVLKWNGIIWSHVEVPEELASTRWTAIHGQAGVVWLAGDSGLWRVDDSGWLPVSAGDGASTIRDLWSEDQLSLWVVGDGGMIRRISGSGVEVMDVDGPDLLAIDGAYDDEIWAVGKEGRTLRWHGGLWFEYLPVVRDDLHAVHTVDGARVWAAGDAGSVVLWDGMSWESLEGAEHVDLRGIRDTGGKTAVTGGEHTLVIGPFLSIPEPLNPTALGGLASLDIQWSVEDDVGEDFTFMMLTETTGLPFWMLMVGDDRHNVPLPDLEAAWGIRAISMWAGPGFVRLLRVRMPDFDIDDHDGTSLSTMRWRAWTSRDIPVTWPF
ncbi:MAG: IPT/TIG domain-containing protein, partial [Myxococcota bacterium]|nr:IPT/TIG domain-containing protein [Myxococcota bacterium]